MALFDFTIHYRTGGSNRATDALSRHPHTVEEINQERGSDCDEVEVISYSLVCEVVDKILYSKCPYVGPKTQPGLIIANGPLDLLCVDFTTMDPSRDSKENVLVLTDAFSKYSQAFVSPNQKALTVAKIIVDKSGKREALGLNPTGGDSLFCQLECFKRIFNIFND